MVVVMKINTSAEQIATLDKRLKASGYQTHLIRGAKRIVIGAVGDRRPVEPAELESMPGVEKVLRIMKPYKLVSREVQETDTIIKIGGLEIGGKKLTVIAGPCAVESREQLLSAAQAVRRSGANVLRGGAYKPRTSPYSFQGLEKEGLRLLAEVGAQTELATITEVVDEESLLTAVRYVDMVQIGARNMQNFRLLRAAGKSGKPVLLKRGLSATVEEWLMAAEYIVSSGNREVILCERGIRTFEDSTRNTLDLSAVALAKQLTHLPVIVDPSHATGKRELVGAMSRAAVAAGADGLIIEVHPDPAVALCDGPQSLDPGEFDALMSGLRPLGAAVGREL
ncbi:Phospho-2-dehydro-3-deoxyheptonate aldolase [Sporotomaculum syntrophicum]|uniref:Phospho-2-dehydro-3-deoxyheptonate aldolase n=1 Tax=Sporotomaculum syntrophicum TaxID=182264 RepID=A0A9D3AWU5_9FIRM|nr:3-deoxy-7-phosphoheptulonate synthase [Sporotomaculum syntrophicum]KAF1084267.1 Phospho-2-dehydro-3-deoxyheptonate aldolase [Sporotomaculum syntrophicum]